MSAMLQDKFSAQIAKLMAIYQRKAVKLPYSFAMIMRYKQARPHQMIRKLKFNTFKLLALCLATLFIGVNAHATEFKSLDEELGFQPHKALYDIKLANVRSGSQILNISGQMFYEWQKTCDAWVTNHRFNLMYEYADSAPMRITSHFSTYEPFDGQSLNFTSQRKRDGELFEEIRGSAKVKRDAGGIATFTMPAELEYDLPDGALFPIAHSFAVAQKIREGKKFYNAVIFDGSDEEGPVSVNTFIGKPVDNIEQTKASSGGKFDYAALDKGLLESPAHNVRLAFFPLNDEEATSDYEMALVFHENSVISDMVIEYDDFSVKQTLIAAEKMKNGCVRSDFND